MSVLVAATVCHTMKKNSLWRGWVTETGGGGGGEGAGEWCGSGSG